MTKNLCIQNALVVLCLSGLTVKSHAQGVTLDDYQLLRFNEIITRNESVPPQNWICNHVDMVEIYNGSDKTLPLDSALGHVRLTDNSIHPIVPSLIRFSFRSSSVKVIGPGARIVIFCDGFPIPTNNRTAECQAERENMDFFELHSVFRLGGGGEHLTMDFVPRDGSGPIILHEVCYPPMDTDVSYARIPEDASNVDGWVFSTAPTFGECAVPANPPALGEETAYCTGAPNATESETPGPLGDTLPPDVERIDYSTNAPAADEAVQIRVRITDEKIPDQNNIVAVQILFRVDSGPQQKVDMSYVDLLTEIVDPAGPNSARADCPESGLEHWSIWEGSIPGQPSGSLVQYSLHVEDTDGLVDNVPRTVCDPGVGPCGENDLADELGPGCTLGQDCDFFLSYRVGPGSSLPLVINEIVPNNDSTFADPSEALHDCPSNPNCHFDDFAEIYNTSNETVALDNVVLTRGPYHPERGWRFPAGSKILAHSYLLVWIDSDDADPVDIGDPPNPNNVDTDSYHTDFNVNGERDELFIFEITDGTPDSFEYVDGVRWGTSGRYSASDTGTATDVPPLPLDRSSGVRAPIGLDQSVARNPDGQTTSNFQILGFDDITPGNTNPSNEIEPVFRRCDYDGGGKADFSDGLAILRFLFLPPEEGNQPPTCRDAADCDNSGKIDFGDALAILRFLFLGSVEIPTPGVEFCGPDPVDAIPDGTFLNLPAQPAAADEEAVPFEEAPLDCQQYPNPAIPEASCNP